MVLAFFPRNELDRDFALENLGANFLSKRFIAIFVTLSQNKYLPPLNRRRALIDKTTPF